MRKGKTCAGVPRPGEGARRRLLKFPKPNDLFITPLIFFIRLVTLRTRGAFRGLRHVRRTHHRLAEAAHLAPVRPFPFPPLASPVQKVREKSNEIHEKGRPRLALKDSVCYLASDFSLIRLLSKASSAKLPPSKE